MPRLTLTGLDREAILWNLQRTVATFQPGRQGYRLL